MELRIGAPVLAEDGRAGTVGGFVFDPHRGEITALVVTQGWLLPHDVVVPIDELIAADEDAVRVRGTAEAVASHDAFRHVQYVAPPEDWLPPEGFPAEAFLFPASPYAVEAFVPASPAAPPPDEPVEELPPDTVDLGPNTDVICLDGPAGTVDRVVTEGESDRVTHLIVRRGTLFPKDREVAVSLVDRVTDAGVFLAITTEELDRLPEFHD
jgi:uncharacterized protein YrrD